MFVLLSSGLLIQVAAAAAAARGAAEASPPLSSQLLSAQLTPMLRAAGEVLGALGVWEAEGVSNVCLETIAPEENEFRQLMIEEKFSELTPANAMWRFILTLVKS